MENGLGLLGGTPSATRRNSIVLSDDGADRAAPSNDVTPPISPPDAANRRNPSRGCATGQAVKSDVFDPVGWPTPWWACWLLSGADGGVLVVIRCGVRLAYVGRARQSTGFQASRRLP